ncbi:MAG: DNA-deoxyinosine glycosylase [Methylomonas sp.]|nr:DNA-deoxyinosine glycosylase [Methylomonas sp.]
MADIASFPLIADAKAHVLILGSIPGKASLEAGQYYAHPRNQFWPIMAELLEKAPLPDYDAKVQLLLAANIALWDVMKSCFRPGSLDAAIAKQTIVANDFVTFFETHPAISHVFFNGAASEQAFRRLVLPNLNDFTLHYQRLPSTSPAHAALSYPQKREHWRAVIEALRQRD